MVWSTKGVKPRYGTGVGGVQRRVGVCGAGKMMEREGSDDERENKV